MWSIMSFEKLSLALLHFGLMEKILLMSTGSTTFHKIRSTCLLVNDDC